MPELRTFIRFFLLLFHRSKVPTSFVPLDQISSVAVLRTEDEYGLDKEINDFFKFFLESFETLDATSKNYKISTLFCESTSHLLTKARRRTANDSNLIF